MLRGNIDFFDHLKISGWVLDDTSSRTAVRISLFENGQIIGRTVANVFRDDLKDFGNGRHAFEFVFGVRLSYDQSHVVHLRTADGLDIPGSPITLETIVVGNIDSVDRYHVEGWSHYDSSQKPVSLVVTVNDKQIGRLLADRYRPDLESARIGNGRHGFNFDFPEPLSLLGPQVIRVRREVDGLDLPGSPVTVEQPQEFDSETSAAFSRELNRYNRDDQIDRKIGFLARELELLLRRQTELDSNSFVQRRSRDLAWRWGSSGPLPVRLIEESQPRALVVDDRLPVLHRDAGSNAIVSHMRSLQRLGYKVSVVASSDLRPSPVVATLKAGDFDVCCLPLYASIEELIRQQAGEFHLIYLHRVANAAQYGDLVHQHFPKARKIFSVADLHHLRISRQATVENRQELLGLAKRMEFRELIAASRADAVITHSSYEADVLQKKLPKANIHRVLWSVSPRPTSIPFADRKGMAFIGGYEHAPNVDAVKWLMTAIMPRIRRQNPEIVCYLVGSGFPVELQRLKSDGVVFVGHVEDLSEIFDRIRLTIAPLSYGAGIKGKIIDSLAAGIPCVHTGIAAEGMDLPQELEICRADNARMISQAVCQLHEEEELNRECSLLGLRYITEELSEPKLDLAMQRVIETNLLVRRALRTR